MSPSFSTPAIYETRKQVRRRWLLLLGFVCFQSVTLATGATIATSTTTERTKTIEDTIHDPNTKLSPRNEPACLQAGGVCVTNNTCPPGFVANVTHAFYLDLDEVKPEERLITPDDDLCPDQAQEGVQCCYKVSISEKRCSAHGGECRTQEACGRAPRQLGAKCPEEGTICCILLF